MKNASHRSRHTESQPNVHIGIPVRSEWKQRCYVDTYLLGSLRYRSQWLLYLTIDCIVQSSYILENEFQIGCLCFYR